VFLTMNETDCTLQSLWQKFDVSFHVVNITGSKSESPKAKIAAPIGQGTHQVWLANIDEKHWLPVWKQPITTVQILHTHVQILEQAQILPPLLLINVHSSILSISISSLTFFTQGHADSTFSSTQTSFSSQQLVLLLLLLLLLLLQFRVLLLLLLLLYHFLHHRQHTATAITTTPST